MEKKLETVVQLSIHGSGCEWFSTITLDLDEILWYIPYHTCVSPVCTFLVSFSGRYVQR